MRPPKKHQSSIRSPLNRILGTEANVRLLRVLTLEHEPLTRSELGRRAGLESKGAHLAALRLEESGLLRRVGSGPRQQVKLEAMHPLAGALEVLFRGEQDRGERILEKIRTALQSFAVDIDAAWLQGPFAAYQDTLEDPIDIGILTKSTVLQLVHSELRELLSAIEEQEEVTIELRGFTRPDLEAVTDEEAAELLLAKSIWGLPPSVYLPAGTKTDPLRNIVMHASRDMEHALLAKEVSVQLLRNPEKRRKAILWLESRLQSASPRERPDLKELLRILAKASPTRLTRFLNDPGERATRLRQSLPFADLFTDADRAEILRKAREQ